MIDFWFGFGIGAFSVVAAIYCALRYIATCDAEMFRHENPLPPTFKRD